MSTDVKRTIFQWDSQGQPKVLSDLLGLKAAVDKLNAAIGKLNTNMGTLASRSRGIKTTEPGWAYGGDQSRLSLIGQPYGRRELPFGKVFNGIESFSSKLWKASIHILAITYLLRRITIPIKRIIRAGIGAGALTLEKSDAWFRQKVALSEMLGKERGEHAIRYGWRKAAVEMGQATEFMDLIRTVAALNTEIRDAMRSNTQTAERIWNKMVHTVQAMVTVFPEYSIGQATSALSRAIAGQYITMARTFRAPRRVIESELGRPVGTGMAAIEDLHKFWSQRISQSAIESIGGSYREQSNNIRRQLGERFPFRIGEMGFRQQVSGSLFNLNTTINEMMKAGKYDRFFRQISDKFMGVWSDITDAVSTLVIDIDISEDSLAAMINKMVDQMGKAAPKLMKTLLYSVGDVAKERGGSLGFVADLSAMSNASAKVIRDAILHDYGSMRTTIPQLGALFQSTNAPPGTAFSEYIREMYREPPPGYTDRWMGDESLIQKIRGSVGAMESYRMFGEEGLSQYVASQGGKIPQSSPEEIAKYLARIAEATEKLAHGSERDAAFAHTIWADTP